MIQLLVALLVRGDIFFNDEFTRPTLLHFNIAKCFQIVQTLNFQIFHIFAICLVKSCHENQHIFLSSFLSTLTNIDFMTKCIRIPLKLHSKILCVLDFESVPLFYCKYCSPRYVLQKNENSSFVIRVKTNLVFLKQRHSVQHEKFICFQDETYFHCIL